MNKKLYKLAKNGDLNDVKHYIENKDGYFNWNWGMEGATYTKW